MKRYEELIFGTKRYLMKANKYVEDLSDEEFFMDEIRFDAMCFVIYTLHDLVEEGTKYSEYVKALGNDVVEELKNIKGKIFKEDNISLDSMYYFAYKGLTKVGDDYYFFNLKSYLRIVVICWVECKLDTTFVVHNSYEC